MRVTFRGLFNGGNTFSAPKHELAAERLLLVSGSFLADATVGTRKLAVELMSPSGQSIAWLMLGDVTAGVQAEFTLTAACQQAPALALGATDTVVGCVPVCAIWPGCYLRFSDGMAISGGDQFLGICVVTCSDDG